MIKLVGDLPKDNCEILFAYCTVKISYSKNFRVYVVRFHYDIMNILLENVELFISAQCIYYSN